MRTQRVPWFDGEPATVEWSASNTTAPALGVVVFLPALGAGIGYYRGMAKAWSDIGYEIAMIEIRPAGRTVGETRRDRFGYHEVLTLALPRILRAIANEAEGQPCFLGGHSLGGQFAVLYASCRPAGISGVIVLAGGSNYYGSMPSAATRTSRHVQVLIVRLINRSLGFFPGDRLGFGGRQPFALIEDWTTEALTGHYHVLDDATDYDMKLAAARMPILLLSLSGDRLVPRSCADFLAGKLPEAQVTQIELRASDYGLGAFDHFRWAKAPEPILAPVAAWQQLVLEDNLRSRQEV